MTSSNGDRKGSREENKSTNVINLKLFLWKSASIVHLRLSDKCERSRRVRSHLRERVHGLQTERKLQIREQTGVFTVLSVIKLIIRLRHGAAAHLRARLRSRGIYVQSGSARQLRENNFSGPLQTPINNKPLHKMDAIFHNSD